MSDRDTELQLRPWERSWDWCYACGAFLADAHDGRETAFYWHGDWGATICRTCAETHAPELPCVGSSNAWPNVRHTTRRPTRQESARFDPLLLHPTGSDRHLWSGVLNRHKRHFKGRPKRKKLGASGGDGTKWPP